MQTIPDKKYPNMYRIKWPNGDLSADFYNLTRVKEHLKRVDIENYTVGKIYNSPMARLEAH